MMMSPFQWILSKLMGRVISVEYAVRDDDDEKRNGYSPDRRGRDRSPARRSHGRSSSPYGRAAERPSPDYGRAPSPYTKPEQRGSPDYGRAESPAYERYRRLVLCWLISMFFGLIFFSHWN